MTVRWIPIVLIWLTVATTVVELFLQFGLMLAGLAPFLTVLLLGLFTASTIASFFQFKKDAQSILRSIATWDDDMKRDIPMFLKARKIRLFTAVGFLILLLIFRFVFPYFSDKKQIHEVILYVFLIGLFHTSFVVSLVLFKISRTLRWVHQENELARLEQV